MKDKAMLWVVAAVAAMFLVSKRRVVVSIGDPVVVDGTPRRTDED